MPENEEDRPPGRGRDRGGEDDRPRGRGRGYDDDHARRRRDEFDEGYDRPRGPQANGLAIAGLILGGLAFLTFGLTAVPGLICSLIAVGKPAKRGAAVGGIVLSILGGLVGASFLFGVLLYSTQKVREAAARMTDQNNLKQLMIGAHSYHDWRGGLLPATGSELSWRVHLLPHIEQDRMFREFDLSQPWDSAQNKPLAARQIKTFVSPSETEHGPDTRYRVFVGPNTLFPPNRPLTVLDITDGTSNTFYIVEAGDTVPWPQPKELPYDRAAPLPQLGFKHRGGFNVAFADGSVRFVRHTVSADALRAGIEPNDGRAFTE